MRSRIRVLAMAGSVIYAAELLSDHSVVVYRDGVYVDDGHFGDGRLILHDEFVPTRTHVELERKIALELGRAGIPESET